MRGFHDTWTKHGDPWIWLNAGALAVCICAVIGVIGLIAANGIAHFWPAEVSRLTVAVASDREMTLIGEVVEEDRVSVAQFLEGGGDPAVVAEGQNYLTRLLIKTGNRRVDPPDFRWIYQYQIRAQALPPDVAVIERTGWGNAYGRLLELRFANRESVSGSELKLLLNSTLARLNDTRAAIEALEHGTINQISAELESLRLQRRALELSPPANMESQLAQLAAQERVLLRTYQEQERILSDLFVSLSGNQLVVEFADGSEQIIELADVLRVYFPNEMSWWDKAAAFVANVGRFLSDSPREANTEGGVYPAIFGTILMVLLMSVVVTPVGVVTAIYLHEYAKQGPLVRILRIAVSNLAGVPSIVYGVFGLGFFVYFLGGNIDRLFFPESLPAPVFGTPGLFWAALTLALLTVPVVIVSTEEGLARIPRSLREGSLALGATRAETLLNVVLPVATPAILTGVILAVARAAGEVAPLMLVGVVKLAPALPIDGEFPFLHLERKFMHLGFHIYDVGFQSPNVEAARPLVYATALLLITIIVGLNLTAIALRNRLEKRYASLE